MPTSTPSPRLRTPVRLGTLACLTLAACHATPDPRSRAIAELVAAQRGAGGLHGGLLVCDDGRTLYRGAVGVADRTTGAANDAETPFEVYSITKSFTAVVVLQLVAEGRLALDDRLAAALPDTGLPGADRITIHDLLSHRSGLPDYYLAIPGYMDYRPPALTFEEMLARLAAMPLEFEPGSGFAYCNTGYALLARIVERITGARFGDEVARRVFAPLGMSSSRLCAAGKPTGAARTYLAGDGGEAPADAHFGGDAGVVSTLDDLRHFAEALGDPALLPEKLWRRAFTAHSSPDEARRPHPAHRQPYGYGFSLGQAQVSAGRSSRVAMHGGLGYGGSTMLQRMLDPDRTVILWNNVGGVPPFVPGLDELLDEAPAEGR